MANYYLITCKNDFPPVDKYTITVYKDTDDMTLRYRKACITSLGYLNERTIIKIEPDELCYLIRAEDLVDAMIHFWGDYMYSVPDNGRG